jgi:hypothetical protein
MQANFSLLLENMAGARIREDRGQGIQRPSEKN